MTTIALKIDYVFETVEIAGDTCLSGESFILPVEDSKLSGIGEESWIAGAGPAEITEALKSELRGNVLNEKSILRNQYNLQAFMFNFYENYSTLLSHYEDVGSFLIAQSYSKPSWAIIGRQVIKIDDYLACGTGMPYATAALECGKTSSQAIEIAAKFDPYTNLPVHSARWDTKNEWTFTPPQHTSFRKAILIKNGLLKEEKEDESP